MCDLKVNEINIYVFIWFKCNRYCLVNMIVKDNKRVIFMNR